MGSQKNAAKTAGMAAAPVLRNQPQTPAASTGTRKTKDNPGAIHARVKDEKAQRAHTPAHVPQNLALRTNNCSAIPAPSSAETQSSATSHSGCAIHCVGAAPTA